MLSRFGQSSPVPSLQLCACVSLVRGSVAVLSSSWKYTPRAQPAESRLGLAETEDAGKVVATCTAYREHIGKKEIKLDSLVF